MHQTLRILKILLASTAIFAAAMLVWLCFIDGRFSIRQSLTVHQQKDGIADSVVHLKGWAAWSPWLNSGISAQAIADGANSTLNQSLIWQHILAGEVHLSNKKEIREENSNTILQTIRFHQPFDCEAHLQWRITQINPTTSSVELSMEGTLPFQYRYLARRMETILFMDIDRSLKLLKDHLENGVINSAINIEGITQQPDRYLVGLRNSCTTNALDSAMQETFVELLRLLELNNITVNKTLSCYYDFGINANKQCEFLCAAITDTPMKESEIPAPLVVRKIKGSKTLKINYTGDYKHLGNAWVTGLTYIRAKGLKVRKRIPPYEIYVHTDANSPAPQEWKTELYIPIR